jgi:F0F1-type ATP synthase membrane subunit b/b'
LSLFSLLVQTTKDRLSEVETSLRSAQEELAAVKAEREMAVVSLKAEAATQLAQARTDAAQQVSVHVLITGVCL